VKVAPGDTQQLLAAWYRRAREAQAVHYESAKLLQKRNLYFGVPVVALSTLVGTSVFASLGKAQDTSITVVVGMLSVLAAILSGLQTFLRFSERAEHHRSVAAKYGSLRRELEQIIASKRDEQSDMTKTIDALRLKMDQLAAEAPATSGRLFSAVVRELESIDSRAT
jgi:hypothetical protein